MNDWYHKIYGTIFFRRPKAVPACSDRIRTPVTNPRHSKSKNQATSGPRTCNIPMRVLIENHVGPTNGPLCREADRIKHPPLNHSSIGYGIYTVTSCFIFNSFFCLPGNWNILYPLIICLHKCDLKSWYNLQQLKGTIDQLERCTHLSTWDHTLSIFIFSRG